MQKIVRNIALIHPLFRSIERQLRPSVWERIFFSAEHRFVYFRVPKSASSTVSLSLAQCMGAVANATGDSTGAQSKKAGQKFLRSGIFFESQLDGYFSFTFVRDPFARALSAYLDKIAVPRAGLKFRRDLRLRDQPTSFRQFLERLRDGFLMSNIHWAPQCSVIPVHPSRLSFVGKVENIEADLPEVLGRIFGPGQHRIFSRTLSATAAAQRLNEFYGGAETRLVRDLYARDFELFYPET